MALIKAATLIVSALLEAVSLVWMEISMFLVAAMVYAVCVGGVQPSLRKVLRWEAVVQTRKKEAPAGPSRRFTPSCPSEAEREIRGHLAKGDHRSALSVWHRVKSEAEAPKVSLTSVVDSMLKLGYSTTDVVAELRSSLASCPGLLPGIALLPNTLLRDDSLDLASGVLALLEERKYQVDQGPYASLMAAQLRRRDYAGVALTAGRLDASSLTPKMRTILATAAVSRGQLDEALGHIRQMPTPPPGGRSTLSPSATVQVLGLAAREHRVAAASEELQRVCARLETKHLDELVAVEGRRCGPSVCRELLDVGDLLHAPKGAGAYQALAGVLASASDRAGVHKLVEDLEEQTKKGPAGVSVGEPLALAVLNACKAVRSFDLATRVATLHSAACAGAPAGRVPLAACNLLVSGQLWEEACDFYEKEIRKREVLPDATLTSQLIKAANQTKRTELVQRLMEHSAALRSGVPAPVGGAHSASNMQRHATMIKAYARERDLAAAADVFTKVRSSGTQMSPIIYNSFLDACVQCNDIAGATRHFQEMKMLGFVDVVAYNTILKMHLSSGNTAEARALVQEMADRGLQANKVTYNELLHAKVIAQDSVGIWNLVEEMHKAGVRTNSVTCSILLKSLTLNSPPADVERVIALIDEVEEPIDEVLLSSVIEACIRIKHLDLLSDLMRRYRQRVSFAHLTAPTYGSMIKAYGQAGDVARVRELWDEMEERGVKPTSITLGCMIEALVTNNLAEEAWGLVHKQLESEDRRGCINTVIYSTVLKGFATTHRMDKVFAVYKEMKSKSIPCNTITYNTLLDACAKCCSMNRASTLLEDMKESCVEPDIITYSTIIKGYCLEGDVDRAFNVLEEMKNDDKFAPDEIMYNSILDGCAKQHRVEEALHVLEEMKATGVGPSNYTLSILVKLLGHARRLNQAFTMVEDLSNQNGFRPNVQVYTCLVQACILNRRLEKAMSLHDKMMADVGCRVDEKFYSVLARGCLQMQKPLKSVEVVRAAFQLHGHSLAEPARRSHRPIGVEARVLEEIAARLQAGSPEEQEALHALTGDLEEHRGFRIGGTYSTRRTGGGSGKTDQPRRGARGGRGRSGAA